SRRSGDPAPSVGCAQMLSEEITAEVTREIPPDGVHVVRVVLRVVVLDQEGRTLDPVVMGLAASASPGPGQVELVETCLVDEPEALRSQRRGHRPRVLGEQPTQQLLLRGRQGRRPET